MVALAGPGWRLAPSLVVYVAEVDARFPLRDRTSDGSIGDLAHASRESDHNPYDGWVHAVDLDEDVAPGVDLDQLWGYLIAKRDRRIRYLIYEGRIVKSYVDSAGHAAWQPYPYTGINAHEHHLHLSISRTDAARSDVRPWGIDEAFPRSSPPSQEVEPPMFFASAKTSSAVWFFEPGRRTLVTSSTDRSQLAKAAGIPNEVAEISDGLFENLAEGRTRHQ